MCEVIYTCFSDWKSKITFRWNLTETHIWVGWQILFPLKWHALGRMTAMWPFSKSCPSLFLKDKIMSFKGPKSYPPCFTWLWFPSKLISDNPGFGLQETSWPFTIYKTFPVNTNFKCVLFFTNSTNLALTYFLIDSKPSSS